MKNRYRAFAWMLTVLALVPTAFTACGDEKTVETKKNEQTQNVVEAAGTDTASDTEDERAAYASMAPAVEDMEEYEFRMAVQEGETLVYDQVAYDSDEDSADTLNSAIYHRNLAIEERYNCTITLLEMNDDCDDLIKKCVQSGEDYCDIFFCLNTSTIMTLGSNNYLYNLYELEDVNLENPWWDQRIQKLALKDQLYMATGDICIRDELREMSVLYDKKLYNQFDYADPYEYVTNGTWTWETMSSMIKDVTDDLNGDGKLDTDDQWGLMTEKIAAYYLFLGSGRGVLEQDGDTYVSKLQDETNYTIMETVLNFIIDDDYIIVMDDGSWDDVSSSYDDEIWGMATKMFSEDRVLFRTGTFGDTVDLRNMQQDFGILPIPKWDEAQEEYYCMVNIDCGPLSIPTTISDPHKTGLITEALAYESMFVLTPAFYDVFLDEKILRDDKSKEMIDLLFDSKVYDVEFMFDITGFKGKLSDMVTGHKNSLTSKIASISSSAEKKIDRFVAKFDD